MQCFLSEKILMLLNVFYGIMTGLNRTALLLCIFFVYLVILFFQKKRKPLPCHNQNRYRYICKLFFNMGFYKQPVKKTMFGICDTQ